MTKKFLVAIALMLCPWSAFSKGIHWIGEWGIGRSVSSIIPIIGNVEETTKELTLEFAEDLGDVVVTVTDASGKIVYQETVSTGNTPTWTVFLDESVQNGTVSITDGINLVYGEISF
ncbi:DUF3244 domain-containing protein [Parabacteroides sp. AD58]|uniref:DUF3244 domain-containing protein n=1 Tax=Parabacteroides absconsus TaxID=2951805 RepID=A0ABZ2IPQ9_9BACT|nr:DUF3244 domain-containing protein [Parabacteroides sp. AD58]MCM6901357.1 DUF3244 domain-containing protein [Parabacteroides sp. AD58]MCM6901893.1 DUF3244 domain-containing protein [Parabacteroides sp. AD58]